MPRFLLPLRRLAPLPLLACCALAAVSHAAEAPLEPARSPEWARKATRGAYLGFGHLDHAQKAGVHVVHSGGVWPYYPLRENGGGLPPEEAKVLRELVDGCHRRGMKLSLGLPPFPPASLVRAHPDWRVHPDDTGSVLKLEPKDDDLGTRIGCNLGPWGDYLVKVCAELVKDYGVDAYSFDGNYHPPVCYCPYCKRAYKEATGKEIPPRVDLGNVEYRRYLVWRGERLEDHYRRLRDAIRAANPEAAVMTWTVNAGRYGHLLHSPRAMPTRLNLFLDHPMQEWWLDETNVGGSIVPSFGAAYARAVTGDRPAACEPYLMSRGNPYGTHSFPRHERVVRTLLATTYGCTAPQSFGWPGHLESTSDALAEVAKRERWLTDTKRVPWAAMLVSEQTRQFYAYQDIAERYLPHLFGGFRAATEEHLPLSLINDWELNEKELSRYRVLFLPNAAALSDAQLAAVRGFVRGGGGLVATCDTSLADELGQPRPDFGLADLFGVSYRGRPKAPGVRPMLDANFAVAVDESYWKQRTGVGTLAWDEHSVLEDPRLKELVPGRSVLFRGPQVLVSEPRETAERVVRLLPEGEQQPIPGLVLRSYGKGRVAYMAAGVDAAYWSYSFPYQRRILARTLEWAADRPFPITIGAPMSVQATYFRQGGERGGRMVIHLFNGTNSTGGHGLPAAEVPLREETVPVHGIRVRFTGAPPGQVRVEPGGEKPRVRPYKNGAVVEMPPLHIHSMLVVED